jgi:hypothetical protein
MAPTRKGARKVEPDVLGAVVQVVRLGFLVLLIALLLRLMG